LGQEASLAVEQKDHLGIEDPNAVNALLKRNSRQTVTLVERARRYSRLIKLALAYIEQAAVVSHELFCNQRGVFGGSAGHRRVEREYVMRQIKLIVPPDHETGGGGANGHCAFLALDV
jgi:hypothetical protein